MGSKGCYTKDNYDLVVSTTLLIVMITTLLFGTFMKKTQAFLCAPDEVAKNEYLVHDEDAGIMVEEEELEM